MRKCWVSRQSPLQPPAIPARQSEAGFSIPPALASVDVDVVATAAAVAAVAAAGPAPADADTEPNRN